MSTRRYDVVLYGASGFTGAQTVQYFAKYAPPGAVRWAIAGRNRERLEAVRAQAGVEAGVEILVADSQDQEAVDALVSQTRVLLNTAGPFALHGEAIVNACVRLKTHYVDITGETPWVKNLIARYHNQAAADGTRIIPCCGFDSVPSDLGTFLVVRHLQRELGVPCKAVKAYFQVYGGFNGGTIASGLNLLNSGQMASLSEPFLLDPPGEHSQEEVYRNQDPEQPLFDADIGTWVGPFFMGRVNTRVVRRSRALYDMWQESYGPDFTYQEYLKFDEPLAWLKAVGMTAGMAVLGGATQVLPVEQLSNLLLPPGSGPSQKTMDEGWFRCELIGIAGDGRKVRGLVAEQGDPGNRSTVKFLCESALSLVLDTDALPGGPERGGVLTPATGLGDVLGERLRKTGTTIQVTTG